LTYFEGLVVNGHLFILETTLFKVRNKEKTFYCYSEEERDHAIHKLKKGVEVTRFKGLGEISANEFKQFIGKEIKLIPVSVNTLSDIKQTLEFYMGKNTPERKQFIMQNLVTEDVLEEGMPLLPAGGE
jgi:DNA gyrase subunit B/topoisomerase-4 subunit B